MKSLCFQSNKQSFTHGLLVSHAEWPVGDSHKSHNFNSSDSTYAFECFHKSFFLIKLSTIVLQITMSVHNKSSL